MPGHDCKNDFPEPARLKYPGPSVHVLVVDINKDNQAVNKLAEFDEVDATRCTAASPCPVQNPAGGPAMQVSFDFGTIACNDPSYAPPSGTANGLTLFATPSEDMRPDPGYPAVPPNQHNPWREYFCLAQPSQKGGWIVQKIQTDISGRMTVFWETFVVLPGQQHLAYPDTFYYAFGAHQDGNMAVNANTMFYEGLSNDFVRTHFFLNMPGKGVQIQQPSGTALSTTDPSVVNQLNQVVSTGTVKASNNLYRAWYLTFRDGRVVP